MPQPNPTPSSGGDGGPPLSRRTLLRSAATLAAAAAAAPLLRHTVPSDAAFTDQAHATGRLTIPGLELPNIGDPFMGGFYAGIIDPSQVPYDSGEAYPDVDPPRYALIVGPRALESATGQIWSSSSSSVSGTRTWWDGLRASEALIAGGHSIGTWLSNLRSSNPVPADDGSDWYIPSLGELSLVYQNLKPDTVANDTGSRAVQNFPAQQALAVQGDTWGPYGGQNYYNPVSEPPFQGYGTSSPSQTPASAFQLGGAQALDYDADSRYWASTEASNSRARRLGFRGSAAGGQGIPPKTLTNYRARPVRRLVLP